MRLPPPEMADPFMEQEDRRVVCNVDGQRIGGRKMITCVNHRVSRQFAYKMQYNCYIL